MKDTRDLLKGVKSSLLGAHCCTARHVSMVMDQLPLNSWVLNSRQIGEYMALQTVGSLQVPIGTDRKE